MASPSCEERVVPAGTPHSQASSEGSQLQHRGWQAQVKVVSARGGIRELKVQQQDAQHGCANDLVLRKPRPGWHRPAEGLCVGVVDPKSAFAGHLAPGDTLLSINGVAVGSSLSERVAAAAKLRSSDELHLCVRDRPNWSTKIWRYGGRQQRVHPAQGLSAAAAAARAPRKSMLPSGAHGGASAHTEDCGSDADSEYEDVEVTVEVDVPPFRPLPGLLVWPNLPFLAFWLFGTGALPRVGIGVAPIDRRGSHR